MQSAPISPSDWMRRQALAAILCGLALRLVFVLWLPAEAGDTRVYDALARNWLDHGVYGLDVDGVLQPVDIRVPGYPAFLAAVYVALGSSPLAVRLVQAVLDLLTCVLIAALAARLAPVESRKRIAAAGLWLAALCPFTANYTAALITETLATLLTSAAVLAFAAACVGTESLDLSLHRRSVGISFWAAGALLVGLGTLVRPETPLLLVAVALLLAWRWRHPRNWKRLVSTGVVMAFWFVLPLLPWAARNWVTLGEVQFLAPRYTNLPQEYVPRGFLAWTNTWLVRMRDVYGVFWKLEEEPIQIDDVPASAFDSPEERARVAALLERYNKELEVTPAWDAEFAALARERTSRHPLRTYVWIPLRRVATMWFTPRAEFLDVSGDPWPPAEKWREDAKDIMASAGLGLLNFVYVGLAVAGAWRCRKNPAAALLVMFVLIRTAFFTQVETPEPRYLLPCFPAVLALAAQVWTRPSASDPSAGIV